MLDSPSLESNPGTTPPPDPAPVAPTTESPPSTTAAKPSATKPPLPPDAADWRARAKALAEFFWPFVNRTDVWGGYHPFKDRGKQYKDKKGNDCELGTTTTRPNKKVRGRVLLTQYLLQRHFSATIPELIVGLHTTSPNNTCRWGALEIDVHGESVSVSPEATLAAGIAWHDQLRDLGLTPLLTGSNGRGGCHLRFLLSDEAASTAVFAFLRDLVSDYQDLGLTAPPEIFPKQAALKQGKYGNWLRLPGMHHTRPYWSDVWNGAKWLKGHDAIDHILSLKPSAPEILAQGKDSRLEKRIRSYLGKLPNRGEGQGRHEVAFGFAAWLARDMHLPDDVALRWLGEWDSGNSAGLGGDELAKILRCAHEYGRRGYGSGVIGKLRSSSASSADDMDDADEELHLTDLGNAKRLVSRSGTLIRYCFPWRKWLVWDGQRWRIDDSGQPDRLAKDAIAALFREAACEVAELRDCLKSGGGQGDE